MSRGPEIGMLVTQAIEQAARRHGCMLSAVGTQSKGWASATFSGSRHQLCLMGAPSAALDAWLAHLPDADFSIHGHLVADVAARSVCRDADAVRIDLEVLTLEEI